MPLHELNTLRNKIFWTFILQKGQPFWARGPHTVLINKKKNDSISKGFCFSIDLQSENKKKVKR